MARTTTMAPMIQMMLFTDALLRLISRSNASTLSGVPHLGLSVRLPWVTSAYRPLKLEGEY
jgi:hypothetical protein